MRAKRAIQKGSIGPIAGRRSRNARRAFVLQHGGSMSATRQERKYLGSSETPELQLSRAQGSFVFDTSGRKYIDFVMGWCVGNFGWGNPEIVRAVQRYAGPDYVYPEW